MVKAFKTGDGYEFNHSGIQNIGVLTIDAAREFSETFQYRK